MTLFKKAFPFITWLMTIHYWWCRIWRNKKPEKRWQRVRIANLPPFWKFPSFLVRSPRVVWITDSPSQWQLCVSMCSSWTPWRLPLHLCPFSLKPHLNQEPATGNLWTWVVQSNILDMYDTHIATICTARHHNPVVYVLHWSWHHKHVTSVPAQAQQNTGKNSRSTSP